ncbi:MAG: putative signal peptide protein [Burkholderiaceae bacterium]|nr:putative signal peptide protein [Burkholderiaceae bacterium]
MENKSHALIAGLFTILLAAAAVWMGIWLNRDRVQRVPYEIATRLSIPGLNPQAAVRYRGLDVGKVDKIAFDPKSPGQILISISINPDTPITQSTYAALGYQGVTGIAYVQFDDDGSKPELVPSSKDNIARIEMRPSVFDNLQTGGQALLEQTRVLADRLNALLDEPNRKVMLAAFHDVSQAAKKLETIPKQLEPTMTQLPAFASEARQAMASINALSKEIGELSHNVNADTMPKINRLSSELRSTAHQLERTVEQINRQPQSLLFGSPGATPGPGETGFAASEGTK